MQDVQDSESQTNLGMLLYPDPISRPTQIYGASFLFYDEPLVITSPPLVIGEEFYEVLKLLQARRPAWERMFASVYFTWENEQNGYLETINALNSLRGAGFRIVLPIYNATSEALEQCVQLATSGGLALDDITPLIDPSCGASELVRHLLVEAYFERGESAEGVYQYCTEFFASENLINAVTKGYLLRLQMLPYIRKNGTVLLTNERLIPLLQSLETQRENVEPEPLDATLITWEIFRQVLSTVLDPLDERRAAVIADLKSRHADDIQKLRNKCLSLGDELVSTASLQDLPAQVERLVRAKVQREVADLLELDRAAVRKFFTDVFSDEKAWLSISAAIGGLVTGQATLVTGGAVAAFSYIGSKAFKQAADRAEKLRVSDYKLLYTISKR